MGDNDTAAHQLSPAEAESQAEELRATRWMIGPALVVGLGAALFMIFVDPWGWERPYIWPPVGIVVHWGMIRLGIAADRRRGSP